MLPPPEIITPNTVIIESKFSFEGIETVLYTRIGANIDGLMATNLAKLALDSARARQDGKDGISYLMNAKKCGIQTPVSPDYEKEILRLTGTVESLHRIRHPTRGRPPRSGLYLPRMGEQEATQQHSNPFKFRKEAQQLTVISGPSCIAATHLEKNSSLQFHPCVTTV